MGVVAQLGAPLGPPACRATAKREPRMLLAQVLTKALTSCVGFFVGDKIAQSLGGAPFDPFRCAARGAAVGLDRRRPACRGLRPLTPQ